MDITMSFIEVIFVFISFCLISAGINIAEKWAMAQVMKRNIPGYIDTAVMSFFRVIMRSRGAMKPGPQAEETEKEGGGVNE